MEKIKVGVIGVGHLGKIHSKLLSESELLELCGVFDIDGESAQAVASETNCKVYQSIEDAINSNDGLIIAAPTINHFEIAKKCIESKKHCFIEKPITTNHNEAMQLISLSKENGTILQVGHVERFNPALASLKSYSINPLFIEAHRLSQFKPRATDVSVIHDLMIHDIDITLWLVKSKLISLDANGVSVLTETPDIANARLTFENGAVANLTASRISSRPMRKMRIFQQNAYISIDFASQDVEVFRLVDENENFEQLTPATMLGKIDAGIKNKRIVFEKPLINNLNAIAEEQKSFAEAISKGNPIAVTSVEAAEALRIAEMIMGKIK